MSTQTDESIVFCGIVRDALPPTTTMHWRNDPITNVVHYDGCCHKYDEIKKLEKEREIKIYLYKSKIYNWVCPHTQEYYDNLHKKLSDERKGTFIPPPLMLKFESPQCCMFDHSLTYSRMNESNIPINIEDALNDPDVLKSYSELPKYD